MNKIGSSPVLSMSIQVAQNSNRSLSSNTLNKSVGNVFRLTTHDGQGISKVFDNVSTDTLGRNWKRVKKGPVL
jgi:hypothetical protein